MKIFLIGYRCTGKTTIGKSLAKHLNYDFFDTDQGVENQAGTTITQMVKHEGWDAFRQLEQDILFKTHKLVDTIISTGGGIILDEENRTFIRQSGLCIWLEADLNTILQRLEHDITTKDSRPALTDQHLVKETQDLLIARSPLYEQTAHTKIDTSINNPEQIIDLIDRRIKDVRQ